MSSVAVISLQSLTESDEHHTHIDCKVPSIRNLSQRRESDSAKTRVGFCKSPAELIGLRQMAEAERRLRYLTSGHILQAWVLTA